MRLRSQLALSFLLIVVFLLSGLSEGSAMGASDWILFSEVHGKVNLLCELTHSPGQQGTHCGICRA